MKPATTRFEVRLARDEDEIVAAQRLRYRVFVEELGAAASVGAHAERRERDDFDPYFDHLILFDHWRTGPDRVVGVYRLMRGDIALAGPGFYSSSEYDLSPLLTSGKGLVELGRSCVDRAYRGGSAILMLWNGVADYVIGHKLDILFGVASFPGTDFRNSSAALSWLHQNHLAPADIRVPALPGRRLAGDAGIFADEKSAMVQLPPLIRGYLRLGGFIGDGAVVDESFNTIDVCLIMDTARMSDRHLRYYRRGRGRE